MSQDFLRNLLQNNIVKPHKNETCLICTTEFGKMSPETGTIERAIRLPCNPNHKVGSACIAKWLQTSNSCPVCRHVFFAPQQSPRAYLEDGSFQPERRGNRGRGRGRGRVVYENGETLLEMEAEEHPSGNPWAFD